ncbi:MAG: hypothetical protein P8M11_13745 [Planctomycetota bacterium]|nr:hypothetical protein [Planctomycetota bacterium]MDG1985620.1 hypothetical protein [Planctomycetota bacterium]
MKVLTLLILLAAATIMAFPTVTITVPLGNAGIGVAPEEDPHAGPDGPPLGADSADRTERPGALRLGPVPRPQAPQQRPERWLEFAKPGTAYGFGSAFPHPARAREAGLVAVTSSQQCLAPDPAH